MHAERVTVTSTYFRQGVLRSYSALFCCFFMENLFAAESLRARLAPGLCGSGGAALQQVSASTADPSFLGSESTRPISRISPTSPPPLHPISQNNLVHNLHSKVFFNSEHLGGNDDVQTLHQDGKLEALVAKVRAEAPGMMKDTWYHPWY